MKKLKNDDLMPLLILFKGLPGTGKSHISQRLSNELSLDLIVRDKLKTILRKRSIDVNQLGRASYDLMWSLAEDRLEKNGGCICDTSLVQPTGLQKIRLIQDKYKAVVVIVECICSDEAVHLSRFVSRAKYPSYYSVNTAEDFHNFKLDNEEFLDYKFPFPTIEVDTASEVDIFALAKNIKQIVATTGIVTNTIKGVGEAGEA